ncbi:MAG: cyclase family protein [bacterium]|nr:cyclase family protein [bacterium]
MTHVIDLTHTITPGMPVYPGTEPPCIDVACTVEKDGFVERKLSFFSHTGTHIDAPAHILPHGPTLDQLPIGTFTGPGSKIDLTGINGNKIGLSHIQPFEGLFETSDFILLHTGWSRFWGVANYFGDYPVLTPEAARWILGFKLKGIGLDMISIDAMDAGSLPIHNIILEQSIIIENLTRLDQLPETGFNFSCFPLNIEAADGSPVRAVAVVRDGNWKKEEDEQ